jgi:hypothetical protein
MELHEAALERLCRVCGQRCVKWPQSLKNHHGLDKIRHKEQILIAYKINVENDVEEIHPKYFCLSCYAAFGKNTRRPVVGWTEHSADPCKACDLMRNSVGRRKRKPATVGVERRQERLEEEREKEAVDKACDVLLASDINSKSPTKKMQKIATAVVKNLMDLDELVELPTGGSVSFILLHSVMMQLELTSH